MASTNACRLNTTQICQLSFISSTIDLNTLEITSLLAKAISPVRADFFLPTPFTPLSLMYLKTRGSWACLCGPGGCTACLQRCTLCSPSPVFLPFWLTLFAVLLLKKGNIYRKFVFSQNYSASLYGGKTPFVTYVSVLSVPAGSWSIVYFRLSFKHVTPNFYAGWQFSP